MSDKLQDQLNLAVQNGDEKAALAALRMGLNPNSGYYLHLACVYNHPDIVTVLIKYGADVAKFGKSYENVALHSACSNNTMECAKLLLDHGCPIDLKDIFDRTAADLAEKGGHSTMAEFLKSYQPQPRDPLTSYPSLVRLAELVELPEWYQLGTRLGLTQEQLTPFKVSNQPTKETLWAAKNTNINLNWRHVLEALVDIGAYKIAKEVCQMGGDNPLIVGAFYGLTDFLKILVETEGLDPKKSLNKAGDTVLSVACSRGQVGVIDYLIKEKGLDPNDTVNGAGQSLKALAESLNMEPVIKYLDGLSADSQDAEIQEQLRNIKRLDDMMNDKDRTDVQYFNLYFAGPSGLGKTTTRKRLVKMIVNIDSLPDEERERCSTLLAECTQVLAILDESNGTITFDVAKDLDEETRIIYKYLLDKTAHKTKKSHKSSPTDGVSQPNIPIIPTDDDVSKPPIQPELPPVGDQPNPPSDPTTMTPIDDHKEDESVAEIVTVVVNKVVQRLRSIVGSGEYAKGLMDKILLNLVDIGGQPGFTEMIPFLTKGIGIFLAFFPLDKNLDDPCEVSYEREGAKITPYKLTYSFREVLSQLLSSVDHPIPSTDLTLTDKLNPKLTNKLSKLGKKKPVATLIGTFKDKLEVHIKKELLLEKLSKFPTKDLTGVIEHTLGRDSVGEKSSGQPGALEGVAEIQNAVDQLLLSEEFTKDWEKQFDSKLDERRKDIETLSSKFEDLLRNPEHEKFFALNNLKGTHKELDPLRKHLYGIFTNEFEDAKLPILPSQLLLGIVLRKEYSDRVVSINDCIKIGMEALNMTEDEVRFAVWYLSHVIGALIYRPDIKDTQEWFKNNLICSPQVVFDSISCLIVEPLKDLHDHGHKSHYAESVRKDWRHGLFSLETIQQCQKKKSSSKMVEEKKLIPEDKLVLLMECSHLLAKIKTTERGEEKIRYFMPAILECATADQLQKPPPTNVDAPSPIKITFEPRYVPIGLFSAMIIEFVSRGGKGSLGMIWRLVESHVKRNLVSFHISAAKHLVTLVAHVDYIEVRVVRKGRKTSVYDLCTKVLSTVLYLIKEINPLVDVTIAFDQSPHSDKLCRLSHDKLSGTCFTCEDEEDVELSAHQMTWFQQEVALGDSAYLEAPPCSDKSLSFKWSKKKPPVSKEGNELVVEKVSKHHCEGYFTCEVLKNGEPLFSVYHCLKIPTPGIEQPLLEREGLPSSDVDQECTDNHLLKVSRELKNQNTGTHSQPQDWSGTGVMAPVNPSQSSVKRKCDLPSPPIDNKSQPEVESEQDYNFQPPHQLCQSIGTAPPQPLPVTEPPHHDIPQPSTYSAPPQPRPQSHHETPQPYLCSDFRLTGGRGLSSSVTDAWELEKIHSSGLNGTGIKIAILDTGFFYHHSAFNNNRNQIHYQNFVTDSSRSILPQHTAITCPSNHCTAVVYFALTVAPNATIYVLRVANTVKSGWEVHHVLNALDHLIAMSSDQRPDIVSMSFSLQPSIDDAIALERKIDTLETMGTVCVAAAGNSGAYQRGSPVPARFPKVISVGSINCHGRPSDFNPKVEHIQVYAPGEGLLTPCVHIGDCDHPQQSGGCIQLATQVNPLGETVLTPNQLISMTLTDTANGTSMAAPMIAGLIALIFQKADELIPANSSRKVSFIQKILHSRELCNGVILTPSYFFGLHRDHLLQLFVE